MEENQINQNQPEFNQNSNQLPQKKSKVGLYIALIIVLIVGISFAAYYFVSNRINEKNAAEYEAMTEERQNAINSIFSVSQYDAIPENYRVYIYNFLEYNNFLDGTYFLTKIADRAKGVYAFGDFTSDDNDEDDIAVLFEQNDYRSSKLVIFNHKGEGLFIKDYENELPTINSFKVGSKIYMNEIKLVPAPCDGLIIKTEYNKYAIVYDKATKKFNSYYQYTEQEIKGMEEESQYYEEEGEPEVEIEDTNTPSILNDNVITSDN